MLERAVTCLLPSPPRQSLVLRKLPEPLENCSLQLCRELLLVVIEARLLCLLNIPKASIKP